VPRRFSCAIMCMLSTLILGTMSQCTSVPEAWAETAPAPTPAPVSACHIPGVVGKRIVIDAGHGGPDSGARGVADLYEKHINLAVAKFLANDLRQAGALVVMTRTEDRDLASETDRAQRRRHRGDLQGRLQAARRDVPDAFVSVHCNAVPSATWRGAQTLYLEGNAQGERLAKGMQEAFRTMLLPTNRFPQSTESLYLLKRVKGPSVLAEIGFVTNPEESNALRSELYQKQIAFAIYSSLQAYFWESEPSVEAVH